MIPRTPQEWAEVKPTREDIDLAMAHMRYFFGCEPYAPDVYAWARGMAVARIEAQGNSLAKEVPDA